MFIKYKPILGIFKGALLFCFALGALQAQELKKLTTNNASTVLTVMTYNVHHCNPPSKPGLIDIDAIVNTIKGNNPDIVALQEIDVNTKRSGNMNEAKLLAKKLGLTYVFAKAIDYDGGEYGIAILSKFSLADFQLFHLPADSMTKGEPRILATVTIKMPSGQTFRFGNTHLDAQKGSVNREMQINEILRIARKEALPFVIAGDFNAIPGSKIIDELDKYFNRTCKQCEPTIPAVNPVETIDFIAYANSKQFEVVSHKVLQDSYSSDHLPVLAVLKLNFN